jgi:DNA repair protein RadD
LKQRFCSISCSKIHSNCTQALDVREKISRTMKARGHSPRIRGGNGKLTRPQKRLLKLLGASWVAEYVVPVPNYQSHSLPKNLKIDIAHPELMIAIELDGPSHQSPQRRQQDSQKTVYLAQKRLVRVSYHKPAGGRAVFNLHVAGHPSYFANGTLVHNCHLIPADGEGMYRQFLAEAQAACPHLRVIGFTATPFRLDAGPICRADHFLNTICYEVGVRELIRDGYLSKLVSKAGIARADTSQLHVRAGEFVASEVEAVMDEAALVEAACAEIVELTKDRHAVLIFAAGVQHGRHVCQVLAEKHGVECGFVCGETPDGERDALLRRFRGESTGLFQQHPLKYLCNVNVLTTGFDAPNVDCVVLLRPTMSPGLYYQMVGRGFRMHPGKTDCLVLDYGGNVLRHGPVDQIRVQDTAARGTGEAPAKECPACRSLIAAAYRVCPDCGHEFPKPEAKKHDERAANGGVLAGEVIDQEWEVRDVLYSVHTKKDAPEHAPKTMRVDYRLGLDHWVSEWICFEHPGWARRKAAQWWKERSPDPVPESAEESVEHANAGALALAEFITVRSVVGEKFDRIIGYKLGPKPEPSPLWNEVDLSDVPF